VPGTLWVPAIQAQDLAVNGGCLLVSLPAERSLAALAVDELARRRIPTRIATRPPPAFAARRALAGVRPGGRISDVAGRIARRLLGLGRSRGDSGQALPALLGAGLILILAALALAAIGGAATGRGRVQRAADLAEKAGNNVRQVQAIADGIQESLREDGVRPALVEGYNRAEWILLDYFDFIVHIFSPATRDFYALDRLWGDAPELPLEA